MVPHNRHGLWRRDGYGSVGGIRDEEAFVGEGSLGHRQVYPESSPLAHATWSYMYLRLHLGHSSSNLCFFLTSGMNGVGGGAGVVGRAGVDGFHKAMG